MAQEKSKCSQTKPHLNIIVILKPAWKTFPGIYIFVNVWNIQVLSFWPYKTMGLFVAPRVVDERDKLFFYMRMYSTCEFTYYQYT
jgi:hypothetical protein